MKCIKSTNMGFLAVAMISMIAPEVGMAADNSGFSGAASLVDTVQKDAGQIASNVSPDKQATTVIFTNLQAVIGGAKGGLSAGTKSATLELPIEASRSAVHTRQFVRGFVSHTDKARAVLVVQSGGHTHLINLDKAKVKLDGQTAPKVKVDGVDPKPKRGENLGSNFEYAFDATIPAGGKCQVTFVLLVERDNDEAEPNATVAVDSFDAEIVKAKKKE